MKGYIPLGWYVRDIFLKKTVMYELGMTGWGMLRCGAEKSREKHYCCKMKGKK